MIIFKLVVNLLLFLVILKIVFPSRTFLQGPLNKEAVLRVLYKIYLENRRFKGIHDEKRFQKYKFSPTDLFSSHFHLL
jgi:hypothetical protein